MTGEGNRVDWQLSSLVKGSPIPLYYQLAELIQERIRAGDPRPGDQLPSERELADAAGISRMTARQAVTYLVRSGALVVRPGVGTFVPEPKLTYDALHLLGFTEETLRHGGRVSSRVLEQAVVVPPPPVATALGLAPSQETVKVVRLRAIDDRPVLLETSHLPASLVPGLAEVHLDQQSLYARLASCHGLHLHHARQTIEATVANGYESELFGLTEGAPMLLVEGVACTTDDRPAEAFKALYRGDRLKFTVDSRRESGDDHAAVTRGMSLVLT